MEILKVAAQSDPNSLAGALTEIIKKNECVEMRVIGAGALNQAIKGVIIAKSFLIANDINIAVSPAFFNTVTKDGMECTGINLRVNRVMIKTNMEI